MTELADPRYRDIDIWDDATALRAMLEGQMAAIAAIAPRCAGAGQCGGCCGAASARWRAAGLCWGWHLYSCRGAGRDRTRANL